MATTAGRTFAATCCQLTRAVRAPGAVGAVDVVVGWSEARGADPNAPVRLAVSKDAARAAPVAAVVTGNQIRGRGAVTIFTVGPPAGAVMPVGVVSDALAPGGRPYVACPSVGAPRRVRSAGAGADAEGGAKWFMVAALRVVCQNQHDLLHFSALHAAWQFPENYLGRFLIRPRAQQKPQPPGADAGCGGRRAGPQ